MVCATDAAAECQVGDIDAIRQTKICTRAHNCTNAINSTCAEVSAKCNISTECSPILVNVVCKGLYNHILFGER